MAPMMKIGEVLQGQVALVIGAGSAVGAASARKLARVGADVAVNDAGNPAGAQVTADAIAAAGGRAVTLEADVSIGAEIKAIVAAVVKAFGRLDILVSDAGLQCDAAFADRTFEEWNYIVAVNLTRQFLCAREAVRQFLAQPPRPWGSATLGKIIFTSGLPNAIPWAVEVNGAASKQGLSFLKKSLSPEVTGKRIRINAVSPGAIQASGNRAAGDTSELILYGCVASPEDIGRAVVWLASDSSDDFTGTAFYVVGKKLYMDNGMLLCSEL
ncbi:MAG: SDR family oxidoreductase [Chloracidobacterium sp.]|nr:SDR family oxidoreductase [Chloracidobacterium sp.]MDW8218008.1 SDR family oxidoreductase [Acidobacteriota bacterium]